MRWFYEQTEPSLYTVSFEGRDGSIHTDSDQGSREDAARRVAYLNGGNIEGGSWGGSWGGFEGCQWVLDESKTTKEGEI